MVSEKKVKKSLFVFFYLLFSIGKNRHGIGKKGGYFHLGIGTNWAPAEGQKMPWD